MSVDFNSFLSVVATIFFLLAVGFLLRKIGVIDDAASNRLSSLIIKIAQPMLIISSLVGMEYSPESAKEGFRFLGAGIFLHVFMAVFAFFACAKIKNLDERKITEFSTVFGNCGFIGFPIFESIFGQRGLFLGAFLIISFHLTLWTWGMMILARKRSDIKITWKKVIINLGTVPCCIGIILFLLGNPLPLFITKGCEYLASLCTPISILITGALIATKPLKQLFTSAKLYYLSFTKLLVLPLLVCAVMSLLNFNHDTIIFCTLAASMPSAAVSSMFGELYSISPSYASQGVGFTTLLSVGTMPLVLFIAPKIIELL